MLVNEPQYDKVTGSPAPWNNVVGDLIMDIHAGVRRWADKLDDLVGAQRQARGSSTVGTIVALKRIVVRVEQIERMSPAVLDVDRAAADATLQLSNWARRCRQQLCELRDYEQPWTRAPGRLRCPNPITDRLPGLGTCNAALWLAPGWERQVKPPVYCRATRCADEHGAPYEWAFDTWHPIVSAA